MKFKVSSKSSFAPTCHFYVGQYFQEPQSNLEIGGGTISDSIWGGAQNTFSY